MLGNHYKLPVFKGIVAFALVNLCQFSVEKAECCLNKNLYKKLHFDELESLIIKDYPEAIRQFSVGNYHLIFLFAYPDTYKKDEDYFAACEFKKVNQIPPYEKEANHQFPKDFFTGERGLKNACACLFDYILLFEDVIYHPEFYLNSRALYVKFASIKIKKVLAKYHLSHALYLFSSPVAFLHSTLLEFAPKFADDKYYETYSALYFRSTRTEIEEDEMFKIACSIKDSDCVFLYGKEFDGKKYDNLLADEKLKIGYIQIRKYTADQFDLLDCPAPPFLVFPYIAEDCVLWENKDDVCGQYAQKWQEYVDGLQDNELFEYAQKYEYLDEWYEHKFLYSRRRIIKYKNIL